MSVYVYAPVVTDGLRDLIQIIGAKRLGRHDGLNFRKKGQIFIPQEDDVVICWGATIPSIKGVKVLNASIKFHTDEQNNLYLYRNGGSGCGILTPDLHVYKNIAQYMTELSKLSQLIDMNRVVPSKLCSGYGLYPVQYTYRQRVHVFGNDILYTERAYPGQPFQVHRNPTGKLAERVVALIRQYCDLDFGVVTLFRYGSGSEKASLHKVITAPALDSNAIQIYAIAIQEWLAKPISNAETPVVDEVSERN